MLNYPSPNPTILADQRRRLAAQVIVGVLAAHGLAVKIDPWEVRIGPKNIWLHTRARRQVSEAIYGQIFPREPDGEFLHYTRMAVFENIVDTGEFRLYSLRKRMQIPAEGEFFTFAELLGWRGYRDEPQDLEDRRKNGGDLFYSSFTRPGAQNEGDLWRDFGEDGRGVRLRFRLNTYGRTGQIRAIQYHSTAAQTLLQTINQALDVETLPPLLPASSYRMSAFSLPDDLDYETEVRLLHMHVRGQPNASRPDGKFDYWPIRIDTPNDIAELSLMGIEAGPHADLDSIRKIVQSSSFARITPVRVP